MARGAGCGSGSHLPGYRGQCGELVRADVDPQSECPRHRGGGGAAALEQLHDRLDGRIEIVEAAVGDTEGSAAFMERPNASELSSLVDDPTTRRIPGRAVPMVTVDSLLESRRLECVDFVKVDVEGYDGRVLAGAARALQRQRLGIVQFEYNRPWALAGSTLGHELRRLTSAGYQTSRCDQAHSTRSTMTGTGSSSATLTLSRCHRGAPNGCAREVPSRGQCLPA